MDIIRSELNVKMDDAFMYIYNMLKDNYDWYDTRLDYDEETTEYNGYLYVNSDIFIHLYKRPGSTPFLAMENTSGIQVKANTFYSTNNNFSLYKQNNALLYGPNTNSSSSSLTTYSTSAVFAIDSINNNTDKVIFLNSSSGYATANTIGDYIILHKSLGTPSPTPTSTTNYTYYNYIQSKTTTDIIQVVPYVVSSLGAQCDTLHGICISPVINNFVIFNDEKWLFSSGIAIPCGDNINYIYYK